MNDKDAVEINGVLYNARYYSAMLKDTEAEISRLQNLHFGEGTTDKARMIVSKHIERLREQASEFRLVRDLGRERDKMMAGAKTREDWIAQRDEATEKTVRLLVEIASGRREGGDAVVAELREHRGAIDRCDEMLAAGRKTDDG